MAGASGGPWDPGLSSGEESAASPATSTTSTDSNPEGIPDWCKPIHKLQFEFGAQPEKVPDGEWQCSLKCKKKGKLLTFNESSNVEGHIENAHQGNGRPVSVARWRCSLQCKKTGTEEVLLFQDSQAAEKHILREHPDPMYKEFACTKCPQSERKRKTKVSPQQILDHQSHTIQKGGHYIKNTVDRRRAGMKSKKDEDNHVRAIHKDTRKEYMVFREKTRQRFAWYICVPLLLTSCGNLSVDTMEYDSAKPSLSSNRRRRHRSSPKESTSSSEGEGEGQEGGGAWPKGKNRSNQESQADNPNEGGGAWPKGKNPSNQESQAYNPNEGGGAWPKGKNRSNQESQADNPNEGGGAWPKGKNPSNQESQADVWMVSRRSSQEGLHQEVEEDPGPLVPIPPPPVQPGWLPPTEPTDTHGLLMPLDGFFQRPG